MHSDINMFTLQHVFWCCKVGFAVCQFIFTFEGNDCIQKSNVVDFLTDFLTWQILGELWNIFLLLKKEEAS